MRASRLRAALIRARNDKQRKSLAPILSRASRASGSRGVAFGNLEYEVRPASIHEVLDERNQIYERKEYMLPLGLAINSSHVARFVYADLA